MDTPIITTIDSALDLPDHFVKAIDKFAQTFRESAFRNGPWFPDEHAAGEAVREALENAGRAISTFLEVSDVDYGGWEIGASKFYYDQNGQRYLSTAYPLFWFEDGSAIEVRFPKYDIKPGELTKSFRLSPRGDFFATVAILGHGYVD